MLIAAVLVFFAIMALLSGAWPVTLLLLFIAGLSMDD